MVGRWNCFTNKLAMYYIRVWRIVEINFRSFFSWMGILLIKLWSWQLCTKLEIILIGLHSTATRSTKPADVATFKPLKTGWKKAVLEFRRKNPQEMLTKEKLAQYWKSWLISVPWWIQWYMDIEPVVSSHGMRLLLTKRNALVWAKITLKWSMMRRNDKEPKTLSFHITSWKIYCRRWEH